MSDQAPARLRIRFLGELDLRNGEVPVPPLGSARAESLLAYVLLHREAAQPRQRLAFLLWPDSSEPQARTNLRHLLHVLGRALPDADRFLEVTPGPCAGARTPPAGWTWPGAGLVGGPRGRPAGGGAAAGRRPTRGRASWSAPSPT